jgi:late competence protein required for DNA uptake (superfamily II DNA/RNA helicase)
VQDFSNVFEENMDIIDEEAVMKCHRCNGSMVYEKFCSEEGEFFGWRCLVCGEVIDQLILENRYGQKQEKPA